MANSILWEYVLAVGVSVFLWFALRGMMTLIMNLQDKKDYNSWDGLGQAIIILFIYLGLNIVLAALFLVANPIRILIKYRQELAEIMPIGKKIGTYLLVGLPIPFSFAV